MKRYEVEIVRSAEKEMRSLAKDVALRIGQKLLTLAKEPRPKGCRKLRGTPFYRLRMGHYRVVYMVDDERRKVVIMSVGHRRDVYRKL